MRKAREPNDKLDRATDKTLAEADHKALHRLCRYSKLERYGGLPVFKACWLIAVFKFKLFFIIRSKFDFYFLSHLGN